MYVAYCVRYEYEKWVITPRKDGTVHRETDRRTFTFIDEEEEEQFKDAWYLFEL